MSIGRVFESGRALGVEQALGRARDPETTAALAGAIDEADSLHRLLDTALEISRAEAGIGRDQFTRRLPVAGIQVGIPFVEQVDRLRRPRHDFAQHLQLALA